MTGRWWLLGGCCLIGLGAGLALGMHVTPGATPSPPSAPSVAAPSAAPRLLDVVTASDLSRLEHAHPGAILLEFHATWCQPCKELAPRVEAFAARHPELAVARADAVTATELTERYGIETLPVLIRLQGGVEVDRVVGAPSSPELEAWLTKPPGPPSAEHASP